jgi:hypothetical protein
MNNTFADKTLLNKISFRRCRLALGALSAILLGVCSYPPNATAETGAVQSCDPNFGSISSLGGGIQPSIAAHSSGLVLEFHHSEDRSAHTFWYHVGKRNGNSVTWGRSQYSDGTAGYWPAVTLSKEGYVIVVYSRSKYKADSDLHYKVGKIDPYGDQNQSIQWLTSPREWDRGFHSSVAINDHGVIVGVHETGHSSTGLYYRVGHFRAPAAGDYKIQWDSGEYGIQYDDGINPHIAINNSNDVVEVHQDPGESLLHYRRGKINGGLIEFGGSKRYDNHGQKPAVALLDDGQVIAINVSDQTDTTPSLYSRKGILSDSKPDEIQWRDAVHISTDREANYPAIAAAGSGLEAYAIETHELGLAPEDLHYSVATVCPLYANGTLVMDYSRKVYVVLNDYRYWIPNPETFDALGYQWDKILPLSYVDEIAMPEGTPFPSVVPVSGPLKYPNGTLVKGLTRKVYVVLNDCRHWIPDPATFDAMGYDYDKILSLGAVAEAMPEGMHFPSVAR